MRALVRGLPAEPASHRRDDGRARRHRRSHDRASLVGGDVANPCRSDVPAQAHRRSQLEDGRDVKVGGQWKYIYRAVDNAGHTIDFLLCAYRDYAAARRFFERAIDLHGIPDKITVDKNGANTAAIEGLRADSEPTSSYGNPSTSTT